MRRLRIWLILIGANVRGKALREWFALAAARAGGRRWMWLALAVVGLALLVVQGWASTYLAHWSVWDTLPESWEEVWIDLQSCLGLEDDSEVRELASPMYALWFGGAIAATVVELFALRCMYIWFRARRLLSTRERCFKCGYTIAGLGVTESPASVAPSGTCDGIDAWVTCSECGSKTPAVAAWGEILDGRGDAGENASATTGRPEASTPSTIAAPSLSRRFSPSTPRDTRVVRIVWTRKRILMLGRIAAVAAGTVILGYAGWWTVREIGIRSQAAIARKERPTPESITAMMRDGLPPLAEGRPTVQELTAQAKTEYDAINTDFVARHKDLDDKYGFFYPDASVVSSAREELKTDEDRDLKKCSLLLMEEVRASNVYKLLDALPEASIASKDEFIPIDAANRQGFYGWMSAGRAVTRINVARMKIARDAGDLDEFRRGARACRAIMEAMKGARGSLIGWLVVSSIEQSTLRELSAALGPTVDRRWLDAVSDEFASLPIASFDRAMQIEREETMDSIAWYFSDPARVRRGLGAPELKDKLGISGIERNFLGLGVPDVEGDPRPRLGSFEENRDAIEALFGWATLAASADAHERRSPDFPQSPSTGGLVIIDAFDSILVKVATERDRTTIPRRGLELMLMIEQYRLDHAEYPDSLDALGPRALSPALFDPFSGQPMRYRRIDPADDTFRRGYLLWSVGFDGVDDGAKQHENGQYNAVTKGGEGSDIIINDPHGLW